MVDRYIAPFLEKWLEKPSYFLIRRGIGANAITFFGLAIVPLMGFFIVAQQYGWAALAVIINRLADGLDGVVARKMVSLKKMQTKSADSEGVNLGNATLKGAYLDIVADYVFYACFPLAFAMNNPQQHGLAACILLASFVQTAVTFLAFSIQAAKKKIENPHFSQKGFYYFSGMVEGAETIVFFLVCLLLPRYFSSLAIIFSIGCFFTATARFMQGFRQLSH